jgi:hypothetical protein
MLALLTFLLLVETVRIDASLIIATIPKSGTHLVENALRQITGLEPLQPEPDPLLFRLPQDTLKGYFKNQPGNCFYSSHLNYTPDNEQLALQLGKKIIMILRDPRDQVVSNTYWMHSLPEVYTQWKGQSFDQILRYNIENIVHFYAFWLPWLYSPLTYTLRFEDLVGEKGGGSAHRQKMAIKLLAEELGYRLTSRKIEEIGQSLYGNSMTFRSGKIGSWKHHFNHEHKALFKKHGGKILRDLAYEEDLNW